MKEVEEGTVLEGTWLVKLEGVYVEGMTEGECGMRGCAQM